MARYRKISTRIWNDARFRELSDDGKLVFLFLLSHPHMTALGAMRATLPGLAAELRWKPGRLSQAFREASRSGIAKLDEGACCVCLPNFVRHNPPESPNVVKAWASGAEMIPECDLKFEAIQSARQHLEDLPEAFQKAFESLPKAFGKGMPYPEQEQEQEQEQDKRNGGKPASPDWSAVKNLNLTAWNRWLEDRKRRKLPTYRTTNEAEKLAKLPHDEQALCVEHSFDRYQGLFPEKFQHKPYPKKLTYAQQMRADLENLAKANESHN